MPLDILLNRDDLETQRTKINAAVTSQNSSATQIATNTANIATNTADIATNTSDIATNTADIATNTADIATNTADIATKQDAGEASTVTNRYRSASATDILLNTDQNGVIHITNSGVCAFTIPLGALNAFIVGQYFVVVNDRTSTNVINVSATGGASLTGNADIATGSSGWYLKTSGTAVVRIVG